MVVVPALARRPCCTLRKLQVPTPIQLGHRAVVDPAQLQHQPCDAEATAPLDDPLRALEHERGARIKAVAEICQGQDLDSPLEAIGSGHLSHAGHRGGVARSTNTRLRSRSDATRTSVLIASMFRPALPMNRPTSESASFTLIATVPPPRSKDSTCTSSGFSARDLATYSISAR